MLAKYYLCVHALSRIIIDKIILPFQATPTCIDCIYLTVTVLETEIRARSIDFYTAYYASFVCGF